MKYAGVFLAALALLVMLFFAAGSANRSAAERERARGQAQAMIIRAQAESRLTAATATAVTLTAALPWGVLTVLGLLGLAVVALAFVIVIRRPAVVQAPPQIIERQIVYLPAPGQPRRELWQTLSTGDGLILELPSDYDQ